MSQRNIPVTVVIDIDYDIFYAHIWVSEEDKADAANIGILQLLQERDKSGLHLPPAYAKWKEGETIHSITLERFKKLDFENCYAHNCLKGHTKIFE